MKRLSIGQRLKKANSYEAKQSTALDWARNRQEDHDDLIRNLELAVQRRDYDLLARTIGQLKAVGEKRFAALPGVLCNLLDFKEKTENEDK